MGTSATRALHTFPAPVARAAGLVTTETASDLLVYDQDAHHIHHLNESSAAVWRLCDGKRSVADISVATGLSNDLVKVALGKLADANLLDSEIVGNLRASGQSRRSLMKKAAIVGAAPLVVSVSAPLAAHATSICLQHCQLEEAFEGAPCGGADACLHGWTCQTQEGTGDYLACIP